MKRSIILCFAVWMTAVADDTLKEAVEAQDYKVDSIQ